MQQLKPSCVWGMTLRCNYRCSYCFQEVIPQTIRRRLHPSYEHAAAIATALVEKLPEPFEIELVGGEVFLVPRFLSIVEILIQKHNIAIFTNLSPGWPHLKRFLELTEGRLQRFHCSLHTEFTEPDIFLEKALKVKDFLVGTDTKLTAHKVAVPGEVASLEALKAKFEEQGLSLNIQLFRPNKKDRRRYTAEERHLLAGLVWESDRLGMEGANSFRSQPCWAGYRYFVMNFQGNARMCYGAPQTARNRFYLGRIIDPPLWRKILLRERPFQCWDKPQPCPFAKCPCPVIYNQYRFA